MTSQYRRGETNCIVCFAFEYYDGLNWLLCFLSLGEVGDWVNYFDAKMCEEMNKACGDKVKAEGLEFVYKL